MATNPFVLPVPLPIAAFNNSGLRESIQKALLGVPEGHGNAILDIDNKGAGVMVVTRLSGTWSVVLAGRYSFKEKSTLVQAALQASW